MTTVPLLICTACYIATSVTFYKQGQIGMSIAFAGYSLGNIGFLYICVFGSK